MNNRLLKNEYFGGLNADHETGCRGHAKGTDCRAFGDLPSHDSQGRIEPEPTALLAKLVTVSFPSLARLTS